MNLADALGAAARPRFALPMIVALGLLCYFTGLGHPMYSVGEPREGVTVIDLVNGRGLILPRDPLVEMPYKPPMMRWLAAGIIELAGGPKALDEFTMRLPSAILGIGGMVVCYAYGSALFEPVVGLVAAVMLGTSIQYVQAATNARVDMTLTFFLEVALFEFLLMAEGSTSRWLLLYLAVAGAVLSKGPVGLVIPAGIAIIWSALEHRRLVRRLHLVPGLIVVAVVAGGWYAGAIAIGGRSFIQRQLIDENLFGFFYSATQGGGHNHSFLWLSAALLFGWLPWSPFLPWVAADLGRERPSPRLIYLLIWVLTIILLYGLAYQKRGIYLVAIYPALALLTANCVRRISAAPALPRWFESLGLTGAAAFGALALGQIALVAMTLTRPAAVGNLMASIGIKVPQMGNSLRVQFVQYAALAWLLPALTLLFVVGLAASRLRPLRLWAMTAAAMVTVVVPCQLFFVPAIANAITLKHFTAQSMRLIGHHPVNYLIGINYEISFYSRRRIDVIASPRADAPDYLFADARYYHTHADLFDNFAVALCSGPANLNGRGAMVLLRRKSSAQAPGQ